jgi:polyphosphate kinase
VELMVPIENRELANRVQQILAACFNDTTQAYVIKPDGTSVQVLPPVRSKPFAMQQHLQELAQQSARTREQESRQTLEPHRPK